MGRRGGHLLACLLLACGCASLRGTSDGDVASPKLPPLSVQQARTYPETVTGRFVPLADFEDVAGVRAGRAQQHDFALSPAPRRTSPDEPPPPPGEVRFTLRRTRTGIGALEVLAPTGRELRYTPPTRDFTGYTLMSIAIHSPTIRDDFRVQLVTRSGSWVSRRQLLRAGWNTVQVDIRRPDRQREVDLTDVRRVAMGFSDAAGPVRFVVDDVILIDNARTLQPAPDGMMLRKDGLDYTVAMADGPTYTLSAGTDGLWRLGDHQAVLAVTDAPRAPPQREALALFGRRRIARVELIEHNAVRVRLASTWYFPARRGAWASEAIRRVRWTYTFYRDGRRVTHLVINNAGGRKIGAVRIRPASRCARSGRPAVDEIVAENFAGPVGRWSWLCVAANDAGRPPPSAETVRRRYAHPATIRPVLVGRRASRSGQAAGFDASEGCYVVHARAGNCRFVVVPPSDGLESPVFRVVGRWAATPSVNCAGRAVRRIVRLSDGSILFALPGRLERPTPVEVAGTSPPGET
ncbi:MAG: hypothetical protein KGY99_09575 [Phycisphaerae bacterium]|nr:hypothetical protein [Phycisphaerae bacterium]